MPEKPAGIIHECGCLTTEQVISRIREFRKKDFKDLTTKEETRALVDKLIQTVFRYRSEDIPTPPDVAAGQIITVRIHRTVPEEVRKWVEEYLNEKGIRPWYDEGTHDLIFVIEFLSFEDTVKIARVQMVRGITELSGEQHKIFFWESYR